MADLPIVYETDEDEFEVLYRVVETLEAAVPYGRWVMIRKVSDLMRAQPEFLVMRDTYGRNLMHLLCENSVTFTNAVDIFLEGPSSIHDMFYEKDNGGLSPIISIVQDLALCDIYEDEKSKEVFDSIIEKVREGGKHDVADDLLEIWREDFNPSDISSDVPPDTPRG